jgi:hypothetical protein
MPSIPIEQPHKTLRIDMEPPIESTSKLTKDIFALDASMEIRNMKNKVAIGLPYYENLFSRFREKGEKFSPSIEHMLKDYDFHVISLSCAFLPDINCRFEWVRLGVQLLTEPKEDAKVKPIVYDLFPSDIVRPLACKRTINIDSELKLRQDIREADAIEDTDEYIVYPPVITAYGLLSSAVAWDFKTKVRDKGIYGDRVLMLIIRAQKNAKVKGRFLVGAEISSSLSKWIPVPVRSRNDAVIEAIYDLSE